MLSKVWNAFRLIGSCFVRISFVVTGGVVISLAFLSLYGYLLTSPYIRLETVVFQGIDGELKDELLQMCNLNFELSLLAVNLTELRQSLEKHPWISSVNLEKRFPHTLVIRAEKEEPWAIVAMESKLYYINRWGKIFKETHETDSLDYPVITGISKGGNGREKDVDRAVQVLRILESEKAPWSLDNLSEVHLKKDRQVSLYFSFLPAVIRLNGTDLAMRMGDLKKVVEHLNSTGRIHMVRSINLNYDAGAAVSFKKG